MDDTTLIKLQKLRELQSDLSFNWWPEGDSDRDILMKLAEAVQYLVDQEIAKIESEDTP